MKALNNELSGDPFYVNDKGCLCAVGAISSQQVLDQIVTYDAEEEQVRNLRAVPFFESWRQINVLDRLESETGLDVHMLKRIQNTHDNPPQNDPPATRKEAVQTANRRVYAIAVAGLLEIDW